MAYALDQASPSRMAGLVGRIARALTHHREFQAVHDQLSALSDRELADIGITRLNVREIACEAAYGH